MLRHASAIVCVFAAAPAWAVSGIVYDASTFEPVAGARLVLLDDATGQEIGREQLGPGQQGQRTPITGQYQFDPPAGTYRIDVRVDRFDFPASRAPLGPAPFGAIADQTAPVATNTVPDRNANNSYYLRFRSRGGRGELSNNHIPLQPHAGLVQFSLAARTARISTGERAAFVATIANGTRQTFPDRDAALTIDMPDGFKYAPGTLLMRDADTGETLRKAEGLTLDRIRVPAGARYEIHVMATAATRVPPGTYAFYARLYGAADLGEVAERAKATLTVQADPIFDRSEIIGRVFCDSDDNGFIDPGERGVHAARVYLDNGSYAVTDTSGKFHFSNVAPGVHLAKVDPDTLPAGSTATRSLRRDFHLTRGLPAKIDFGFRCAVDELRVPQRAREAPTIEITGRSDVLAVTVGADTYVASEVDISTSANAFKTRVKASVPPHHFAVLVRDAKQQVVYRIDGAGIPPAEIPFDARALDKRQPHTYELALWSHDIFNRSARKPLPLEAPQASSQPTSVVLRGELFTKTHKPTPLLMAKIGELKPRLQGRISVEVHTADDGPAAERITMSEKRAQSVKNVLVGFGVTPAAIAVRGKGDKEPAGPNLGQKGREKNRRIVLTFEQPASAPASQPASAPVTPKLALVHGARVPWEGNGFKTRVLPAEQSSIFIQSEDGRAFGLRTGAAPRGRGKIEVAGGLASDRIFVDGLAIALPLASFSCSLKALAPVTVVTNGGFKDVRVGLYGSKDTLLEVKPVDNKGAAVFDKVAPGAYTYRCTARDGLGGQVITAPEIFTVAAVQMVETTVRGDLFNKRAVGADLKAALDKITGAVEIEVHGGGNKDAFTETRETSAEAAVVQLYLAGRGVRDVKVRGMGKSQLLAPATSRKAIEKNRRVVLRVSAPASAPASDEVTLVKAPSPRRVTLNGEALKLDDKGHFALTMTATDVLTLQTQNGQGRESTFRVPLGMASAQSLAGRLPFAGEPPPERPFLSGETRVASMPASAEALGVTLELPRENATVKQDFVRGYARGPAGTVVEVTRPGRRKRGHLSAVTESAGSQPASMPASQPASEPASGPASASTVLAQTEPEWVSPLWASASAPASRPSSQPASAPSSEPASQPTARPVEIAASQPSVDDDEPEVISRAVIGADGEAELEVPLEDGSNALAFNVKTPSGAAGELKRKYEMSPNRWFLMALGEGSLGQAGARAMLPETDRESTLQVLNGEGFLHGRAMLYFKGRIKGDWFFKDNRFTAYADSAGTPSDVFWRQVVEPDRFYPVYGDASEEVQEAQSQHKLYVLIEADESKLQAGNVLTQLRGVELFRYDRALFGARVDFDKSFTPNQVEHTKLVGFGGQPLLSSRRVHASLRGTGGSLYFLRDRDIIEGSEQVKLVVRDSVSGSIVQEVPKRRNVDYTIQYDTGRIVFLEPVSAYTQGSLAARLTPISVAQGDTVNIEVDYEARDFGLGQQVAGGGYVKESVFDNRVTLGGGYVHERRGDGSTPDYKLYGGSLELRPFRGITLAGELNRSEGKDLDLALSTDGGQSFADIHKPQTYTDINGRTQTLTGWGMRASGSVDVQKLLAYDRELVTLSGYAQRVDPNYFAGLSMMEQGQLKFGAAARGAITKKDFLLARHDGSFSDLPSPTQPTFSLRRMHRELTAGGYEHVESKWDAGVLYYHTFADDSDTPDNEHTDTVNVRGAYKVTPKLTLFATQEFVIRPDRTYIQRTADQFATEVGARYRLTDKLEGQVSEIVRYGGSNATQVGLRVPFGEDGRVYVSERFGRDLGGWTATTIVGAENSVARGSKAYGEYHLNSGSFGPHARAVYGLNNRWELADGLYFSSSYERMQNAGNQTGVVTTGRGTDNGGLPTSSPSFTGMGSGMLNRDRAYFAPSAILGLTYPAGIASRDALSAGIEFVRLKFLKITSRFEVRFDNRDINFAQRDRLTLFGTVGASAQLHKDLTFLSRVEIAEAIEPETRLRIGALNQMTFGLAYRPVMHDYFHALLKYTRREFDRPRDLGNAREHEILDVISFVPVGELPLIRTQLVEKVAFKFQQLALEPLPLQRQVSILWINRLNFHVFKWLDVGAEYRMKRMTGQGETQGGFLAEVSVSPIDYMRIGAGYNFTHFSDDELADDRIDNKGFFIRAIGKY